MILHDYIEAVGTTFISQPSFCNFANPIITLLFLLVIKITNIIKSLLNSFNNPKSYICELVIVHNIFWVLKHHRLSLLEQRVINVGIALYPTWRKMPSFWQFDQSITYIRKEVIAWCSGNRLDWQAQCHGSSDSHFVQNREKERKRAWGQARPQFALLPTSDNQNDTSKRCCWLSRQKLAYQKEKPN